MCVCLRVCVCLFHGSSCSKILEVTTPERNKKTTSPQRLWWWSLAASDMVVRARTNRQDSWGASYGWCVSFIETYIIWQLLKTLRAFKRANKLLSSSDPHQVTFFDIFSGILSGIHILSHIFSDSLSGILSGISWGILCSWGPAEEKKDKERRDSWHKI